MSKRLLIALSLIALIPAGTAAQAGTFSAVEFAHIETDDITVCPAAEADTGPPDFSSKECRSVPARALDPQGKLLWVRTKVVLEETRGPEGEPLSIYLSGKMAAEVWLNGQFAGRNGTPGMNAASESPGRMDGIIHPPQTLFRKGVNEIVLRASAHHGFLKLAYPVHLIAVGLTTDPAGAILRHYWPSLLTLGLFVLGALYFGIAGVRGPAGRSGLTLAVISTFAAAQLLAEAFRGLIAYPYPLHDLRLILITMFSAGFGLSVAFHVLSAFACKHVGRTMAVIAGLCVAGTVAAPGYDSKAMLAMLIPLSASLVATGIWSYRREPRAFLYFLALLAFIAAIIIFAGYFLDVVFFFLVSAFLCFLFVEQGFALAREACQRRIEEARANRLELALEQARQREEVSRINVKSAGRMERIAIDRIVHLKGASGYSEIVLADGRELLHSATLAEMEDALPATFLRVHRSHLVNTAFVKTLNREPSGTGLLILTDGSEIPVSRRVMPQVRQALG